MNEDQSQTQGDLESLSARANLMRRYNNDALNKVDALLQEARLLNAGTGVSYERLMGQIQEAQKLIGLLGENLPRGYTLAKSTGRAGGYYLKKHGLKVDPDVLAMDIGSGWIYEFANWIDGKLEKKRPAKIEGKREGPQ